MYALLSVLQAVAGIGSLVCFVLVLIKMFQNDATTVAIVSLLLLLCGIGALVAFIYGWMKAAEWNIGNVMLAWTGCIVGGIVLALLQLAVAPSLSRDGDLPTLLAAGRRFVLAQ